MKIKQLKEKLEEELKQKEIVYNNYYDGFLTENYKLEIPRPHLLVQINYIKEILSWLE